VTQCYSTGAITGEDDVGGFVGFNAHDCHVSHCYSTGAVSGDSNVGGLVGSGWAENVTAYFWDIHTSDFPWDNSVGGTGKTTEDMHTASTFLNAGWDFVDEAGNGTEDIWWILEGKDYPRLWWESRESGPTTTTWEGSGTPDDPYQISTAVDLILLGDSPKDYDKHFILTADIDLDTNLIGRLFFYGAVVAPDRINATPQFDGTPFNGVFDGNGHTILHLTINGSGHVGLFGCLSGEVMNLGVVDANITGSDNYVGGLVGSNSGNVTHCNSIGPVTGTGDFVGGLVGCNGGDVTNCYSTGVVTGSGDFVGGLIGSNVYFYSGTGGIVTNCCSSSTVNGREDVGGLVGCNYYGYVTHCYSTGSVSGISFVGGLAGSNLGTVSQCYSTGLIVGDQIFGGLVGIGSSGAVTDCCFWDIETSGQAISAGGTGKTTGKMQMASTFLDADWDFVDETENGTDDIWWIDEGQDYPRLWWENRN